MRFEDSHKRIDRAIKHARTMSKQWAEMFDKDAQPYIERVSDKGFVAKVKMRSRSDNDLSLELGEFFYQLRAALDGLAYQVMELETASTPPPKENRIEFPIYEEAARFAGCPLIKEAALPKYVRDWLQSIQPYCFAKSTDEPTREVGRRLKLLHDCARKDRHRRLHVVVAGLTAISMKFKASPGVVISNVQGLPIDFLTEDDTAFVEFDATFPPEQNTNIQIITSGQIEFGILEFPDHVGQAAVSELERIMLAVRYIVSVFEDGYPL